MDFSANDFAKIFDQQKSRVIRKAHQDSQILDSLDNLSTESYHNDIEHSLNESSLGLDSIDLDLQHKNPDEFFLQQQIREAFGKGETFNTNSIASHPDFKHLIYGGTQNQFITTMFIDIKGSTGLTLLYDDLEFIYNFKNSVIRSCIEVIRSFDGYVHRIMGDAVLGFFGSSTVSKEQSILDCINCAAMLTIVLENMIKPWLKSTLPTFDLDHFGFRIGCNFGDEEDILWGNYGYGTVGEISPTGLQVDLASKLQGLASANQIMLGEDLLKFSNWPIAFTSVKKDEKKGTDIEFITPTYHYADGSPLNYMMRLLDKNKYLLGFPISIKSKLKVIEGICDIEKVIDHPNFKIETKIKKPNDSSFINYISNSKIIPKGTQIEIKVFGDNFSLGENFKVKFYKENRSGFKNEEALERLLEPESEDNNILIHSENGTDRIVNFGFTCKPATFSRECSYRGIHTVRCEVIDKNHTVIFRDYIYVPIQ